VKIVVILSVAKLHTAGSDTIFIQIYMDALPVVPGVSKNYFYSNLYGRAPSATVIQIENYATEIVGDLR
jgi:hypothetical protein